MHFACFGTLRLPAVWRVVDDVTSCDVIFSVSTLMHLQLLSQTCVYVYVCVWVSDYLFCQYCVCVCGSTHPHKRERQTDRQVVYYFFPGSCQLLAFFRPYVGQRPNSTHGYWLKDAFRSYHTLTRTHTGNDARVCVCVCAMASINHTECDRTLETFWHKSVWGQNFLLLFTHILV